MHALHCTCMYMHVHVAGVSEGWLFYLIDCFFLSFFFESEVCFNLGLLLSGAGRVGVAY